MRASPGGRSERSELPALCPPLGAGRGEEAFLRRRPFFAGFRQGFAAKYVRKRSCKPALFGSPKPAKQAPAGIRRFSRSNSKRVTAASKCVSGGNSFCGGVVSLAYLSAYNKVFRFRRVSPTGWRSPGTSILQSDPQAVQESCLEKILENSGFW